MTEESQRGGVLYIVATPIGNLEDITLRAIRILKEADEIFCEDTRVTKKLLNAYEIKTPLARLDAHTENTQSNKVIEFLNESKSVAYVSDAGTPCISDPGHRLTRAIREAGFRIEVIPGASSVVAALSISGIPADNFLFLGFLPHKKGRQTMLKEIADTKRTIVLFESTHRITRLLGELKCLLGSRGVVIARELTKKFEEVLQGDIAELLEKLEKSPEKQKGEFVLIIEPKK